MTAEVADVEYIVTDTVSEAFLLEGNLIKEHRPRFNIRLRDDKSYPFVKITLGEDFPRIVRTRKLVRDGSRYFGPYASASSVDETLKLLRKIFPFRTCNLDIPEGKRVLERPCLLYYINRCQGPCIQAIEKAEYRATIGRIVDFLEGRQEGIADELRSEMQQHSRRAALRAGGDRARQAAGRRADHRAAEGGRLQPGRARRDRHGARGRGGLPPALRHPQRQDDRARALHRRGRARRDRCRGAGLLPAAVLRGDRAAAARGAPAARRRPRPMPWPPSSRTAAGRACTSTVAGARREAAARRPGHAERGRGAGQASAPSGWPTPASATRRSSSWPRRSACARARADRVLRHEQHPGHQRGRQHGRLHQRPARAAGVPPLPDPIRRHARRLPDDGRGAPSPLLPRLAAARRDRRPLAGRGRRRPAFEAPATETDEDRGARADAAAGPGWAMPDLVIVDGGKGQLSAAVGVMRRARLTDVPLTGLAKRFEELYLPGDPDPSCCRAESRRSTSSSGSATRRIGSRSPTTATCAAGGRCAASLRRHRGHRPGRKKALLKRFGSVRRIREASVDELAETPGIPRDLAERLKGHLAREGMLA